eukprot:3821697-Prymnesium_polylepis.1
MPADSAPPPVRRVTHTHNSRFPVLAYRLWPMMRREAVTGATRALRCPCSARRDATALHCSDRTDPTALHCSDC